MKRIRERIIAQSCGETLVETLAAILVCSFAVIILATAITTAVHLDIAARAHNQSVTAQQTAAETHASEGAESGTITITGTQSDTSVYTYNVTFHGGDSATSYTVNGVS